MQSQSADLRRPGFWGLLLGMAVNPAAALDRGLAGGPAARGLTVAALAFAAFFAQTARDAARWQGGGLADALGLALLGALFGVAGVALAALAGWLVSTLLGAGRGLRWTVAAFGMAYAPLLVYALCGLACNLLFGWNTAVAFGASGLLWSVRPLAAVCAALTGGRLWAGAVLSTLCGGAMLLGWAALAGVL